MLCPSDVECALIERKFIQLLLFSGINVSDLKKSLIVYFFLGFKSDERTQQAATIKQKLDLLDQAVREHLSLALKAQTCTSQTDCMIGYVRDMLLKVRIFSHKRPLYECLYKYTHGVI